MRVQSDKEKNFITLTDKYKNVVGRVCCIYASTVAPFDDLYQEVLINIWQGMDNFRGDSKISTWIYRTAINTCITWHRKNRKHSDANLQRLDEISYEVCDDSSPTNIDEDLQYLKNLISQLGVIDRAIITMWLDECPYEEISAVTGLTQSNVGVRVHRIKQRLAQMTK